MAAKPTKSATLLDGVGVDLLHERDELADRAHPARRRLRASAGALGPGRASRAVCRRVDLAVRPASSRRPVRARPRARGDGIPEASDRVASGEQVDEQRSLLGDAAEARGASAREAPSGLADPVPAVGSG